MGRRSGGRKTIIPVVGHPYKTTTSEKWARQAQRQGKGQIVDSVFYWFPEDAYPLHTHRDRELREIEKSSFEICPQACDIAHEHENRVDLIPGGPQFKTVQFERTLKSRDRAGQGAP